MLAQTAHCSFEATQLTLYEEWHRDSNYICILVSEDLEKLYESLRLQGIETLAVYEPDLDNLLTAICIEPTDVGQKALRKLKLAPGS